MRDKNKPIEGTDVILEGKNKNRLYYANEESHPSNGTKHTQNVVLDEVFFWILLTWFFLLFLDITRFF